MSTGRERGREEVSSSTPQSSEGTNLLSISSDELVNESKSLGGSDSIVVARRSCCDTVEEVVGSGGRERWNKKGVEDQLHLSMFVHLP